MGTGLGLLFSSSNIALAGLAGRRQRRQRRPKSRSRWTLLLTLMMMVRSCEV
ncbi:hypothetical protein CPC08DRAFT_713451, partial [Agrocybe pediades]